MGPPRLPFPEDGESGSLPGAPESLDTDAAAGVSDHPHVTSEPLPPHSSP